MAESNSMLEQNIQTVVPENLFGTDFIAPNAFTKKLKPSSLDWNQTINKEDTINKFYFTENDEVNFVDESKDLTSAAFSTTEDTTQPVISDETIKFLGVQTYFHKGEPSRKPQTRIKQGKLFTELTGYTVDQLINNDIPQDVLKSSKFQSGINSFYETNSDKITLADKNNLSINDMIALQASGLLWEIGTGMRTDIVTLPLLKKGPKGIAAYGLINFISGILNNLAAQRLRGETNISKGEGIAAGIVQMIPFGSTAKGLKGYMGAATQGAFTAGTEATIRTGIDEQRFLTKEELATSLTFGTLFGTGLKGLGDSFSAIVNKYQGKSAAEIDNLLTKEENNLINTILEKTAKPAYAMSPDLNEELSKLSEQAKKVVTAIQLDQTDSLTKQEIIESIEEIGQKYPERLTPDGIKIVDKLRELLGIDSKTTSKTTGRQKILPGTPHPTDANKVRGYDGRWVTKKHFDQVTKSREGADKIKEQVLGGADQDQPPKLDLKTDTRGKGEFYHGAADEFELDSSSHYSARGLYGQGLYTTDDLTTAGKYQKKNKARKPNLSTDYTWSKNPEADYQRDLAEFNKKPQKQTIYKITEKQPVKFFDLDQPVTQDIIEKLEEIQGTYEGYNEVIGRTFDEFKIGSYNKSTGKNPSLAQIIDEIRANNKANSNMSIDELDNITVELEEFLRGKGFGGFTHRGGKKAGKGKRLHQVKIYWDPQDQLDINKVDIGDGGAIPPKDSPGVSQGDGPLKGTDTTPHQINPNQVTNAVGSDQQKQFNFIVKRIKQLKDEGAFSQIKTTADTIDGGIKMLADTNKVKEHAKMYAKIYNLVPTDELNYALAEAITIALNKTTAINQDLINAINVSKDPASIKKNINAIIESIGEIDEWLRLGIPLRTEAGRALRSMQIPTQGVTPEAYSKMSAAEKYKLKNLERSSVGIAPSEQGSQLSDLKTKLLAAFEQAQETGDYTTLNKLTNTIKRANASDSVTNRVEKMTALYETGTFRKIIDIGLSGSNKFLKIFNEIGINALLYAPTTNEINLFSGILETYMSSYELIRGAGSRTEFDAAIKHLIGLHTNGTFTRKAFVESLKMEDNYINRGAVKADYQEKFVISSEGKDLLSKFYDGFGKAIRFSSRIMTSNDALIQAHNLIGSIHYFSYIEGVRQGKKGAALDDYIKGNVDAVIEYYAANSGKGIKDTVLAKILKRSQEFAKRSTFTEDIRQDDYAAIPFGQVAAGLNQKANEVPLVRALMSFVRAPTNIIKRQLRRSPVLNLLLKELSNDLQSSDPIVRNQARGQVKVAKELGITITALAGAGMLMQQNPDFVPPIILTGGGPDWKTKEGRAVYKSMIKNGWLPYSAGYLQKNEAGQPLIGEDGKPVYKYYSYERLDPLSSWIGLMVDFVEISPFLTNEEYDDFTVGVIGAFARNITDRSYLQQLDQLFKAFFGVEEAKENFAGKFLAARFPFANFTRYAKQVPGDLLDIVGVSKEDSARFHQKKDLKVRAGDFYNEETDEENTLLRAARKLLNRYTETVPGYSSDLPFLHEHITNEPILYPQRPGLDLFNWVKTSTSKNHPLWTAMALIGKELKEPSDTFTGVGTSKQMEAFRLDTHEYANLKQIINTIEAPKNHPLYPGANIDQAIRIYLKSDHYKKNSAIVKENGPLSKNSQIARDEIYLKLKTINSEFINAGQLQWINSQGTDKIQLQFDKKRTIVEEYLNNIKALSPD